MRWSGLNLVLLASFALIAATNNGTPRQKRDLSYLKHLIKTTIFGSKQNTSSIPTVVVNEQENVKIFRIPGFSNILVKAVPKVTVATETGAPAPDQVEVVSPCISKDPIVTIVNSYLGTKSSVDTLNALQEVQNLLASGILNAKKETVQEDPQIQRLHFVSIVKESQTFPGSSILIKSPDTDVIKEPVYVLPVEPEPVEVFPAHTVPLIPVISQPIVPIRVPIIDQLPISAIPFPTEYSYKQIHRDGSVTTYTANDDQNVIVTKSDKPVALPPYITSRIREVLKLGLNTDNDIHMKTFPIYIPNHRIVQFYNVPKVNPYKPQFVNHYSYKQIHNDGKVTEYSDSNVGKVTGSNVPSIPQEKVAEAAVSNQYTNPLVLAGQISKPAYGYEPVTQGYPTFDEKGKIQIKINSMNSNQTPFTNAGFQGTYSYKTVHRDGTVSTHTEVKGEKNKNDKPVVVRSENTQKTPDLSAPISNNIENITKSKGGLFSYKIIHQDGTETTYGLLNKSDQNLNEAKDIKVSETHNALGTKNYSNVDLQQNAPSTGSTGSFSYKVIHNDGTVSFYNGDNKRNGGISSKVSSQFNGDSNTKSILKTNAPLVYQTVHNDRVTNYGQLSMSNQLNNGSSNIYKSIYNEAKNTNVPKQQKNQKVSPNKPTENIGSFYYKVVHNDDSINSDNGNSETNNSKDIKKSETQKDSQMFFRSTGSNEDRSSFSYKVIDNDGTVHFYRGETENNSGFTPKISPQFDSKINSKNEKINGGSFLYKIVHSDGTATNYEQLNVLSQINNGSPVKWQTKYNEANDTDVPKMNSFNTANFYTKANERNGGISSKVSSQFNAKSSSENVKTNGPFSYKIIHRDGTVTNYGQPNNQITNGSPIMYESKFDEAKVTPAYVPKEQKLQEASSSDSTQNIGSFYYTVVHNDGSVNNYKGESKTINYINKTRTQKTSNEMDNKILQQMSLSNEPKMQNHQKSSPTDSEGMSKESSFHYTIVHNDSSVQLVNDGDIDGNILNEQIKSSDLNKASIKPKESLGSYSYKIVHNDGSVTSHIVDSISKNWSEENKKDNVDENVNNKKQNDFSKSSSFSYKTVHTDGTVTHYTDGPIMQENTKLDAQEVTSSVLKENNLQVPTVHAHSLHSPSYKSKWVNGKLSAKTNVELSTHSPSVTPVNVVVADQNAVLFSKPVVSSYRYKQMHQNSPNAFTIVNIDETGDGKAIDENQKDLNGQSGQPIEESKDYVYIPPNVSVPLPIKEIPPNVNKPKENLNNADSQEPCETDTISLSKNPIVVLDGINTYSYKQKQIDGSFVNIEDSQNNIAVKISAKKAEDKPRGDIPE